MTTQRTPEFGLVMEASPGYTARLATAIEAMGFDYLLCPDTQNLAPDPYGPLSLAAAATTGLGLGTGVTNPITRDAAVTATAIMTLQQESAGRAICVIGRGDSSAAHIGTRNATTAELRTCIERLRAYMAGEAIVERRYERLFLIGRGARRHDLSALRTRREETLRSNGSGPIQFGLAHRAG